MAPLVHVCLFDEGRFRPIGHRRVIRVGYNIIGLPGGCIRAQGAHNPCTRRRAAVGDRCTVQQTAAAMLRAQRLLRAQVEEERDRILFTLDFRQRVAWSDNRRVCECDWVWLAAQVATFDKEEARVEVGSGFCLAVVGAGRGRTGDSSQMPGTTVCPSAGVINFELKRSTSVAGVPDSAGVTAGGCCTALHAVNGSATRKNRIRV